MPHLTDRATLRAILHTQVQAAAGDPLPPIAQDYDVGTSGAVADLVVAAEEFIAFVVHVGGEPLDALGERLAICARYFDRVVLVAALANLSNLAALDRAGAALWTVNRDRALVEQHPGIANQVSPSALFDMMTPDQRARLLRPALRLGFDRTQPAIGASQVRAHWSRSLAA